MCGAQVKSKISLKEGYVNNVKSKLIMAMCHPGSEQ